MHAFALPLALRVILVGMFAAVLLPRWPVLPSSDRLSVWMIMLLASSLIAVSQDTYYRQCFQQQAFADSPPVSPPVASPAPSGRPGPTSPGREHASADGVAIERPGHAHAHAHAHVPIEDSMGLDSPFGAPPPLPTPLPTTQAAPPFAIAEHTPQLPAASSQAPPPVGQVKSSQGANLTPPVGVDRDVLSAATSPSSATSPSPRKKPPARLSTAALKPHALGRLPTLESFSMVAADSLSTQSSQVRSATACGRRAAGTPFTTPAPTSSESEEWPSRIKMHVALMSLRLAMICTTHYDLRSAIGTGAMIAMRLLLSRLDNQQRARQLYQTAFVLDSWSFVFFPWITLAVRLRSIFIASQIVYPFLLAFSVPSTAGRLLVVAPRLLTLVLGRTSHRETRKQSHAPRKTKPSLEPEPQHPSMPAGLRPLGTHACAGMHTHACAHACAHVRCPSLHARIAGNLMRHAHPCMCCYPSQHARIAGNLMGPSATPSDEGVTDLTTFSTLEQLLVGCAFGSGTLAYYIGTLTRRLQRQNTIRLENMRLRDELQASMSAVTESREHILELQRLVGASASEQRMLSLIFEDAALPEVVLKRRLSLTQIEFHEMLGKGYFGQVSSCILEAILKPHNRWFETTLTHTHAHRT